MPANGVSFLGKNSEKGILDCLLKLQNGVAARTFFPERVWFVSNFTLKWFGFTNISRRNSGKGRTFGFRNSGIGPKILFGRHTPVLLWSRCTSRGPGGSWSAAFTLFFYKNQIIFARGLDVPIFNDLRLECSLWCFYLKLIFLQPHAINCFYE